MKKLWPVIVFALGAVACDALFGDAVQCSTDADCARVGGTCSAEGLCATAQATTDPTQPKSPPSSPPTPAPASTDSSPATPEPTATPPDAQPTATSKYAAAIMADKPLTYLRLGESSGAVANDETKTVSGTYSSTNGGLSHGVQGPLVGDSNTAVTFAGSGGIAMPPGADFGALQPFSVELWFRIAADNTDIGFVVDHETFGPRQGWNLRIGDALQLERWTSDSTASVVGVAPPAAGTWHYLVAAFDGAQQLLYLDGTLVAQAASTLSLPARQTAYSIGRQNCANCGDSTAFHGDLDEIAIYDKALSAAAVSAHYAAAK